MKDGVAVVISADEAFRQPLLAMVEQHGWIAKSMNSAAEFLGVPVEPCAWCLVVDARQGAGESVGLGLMRELGQGASPLPLIAITAGGDVRAAVAAAHAGALEVLEYPFTPAQLANAIPRAFELCQRQHEQLLHRHKALSRLHALTVRERAVLCLILKGRLNKQIAMELDLAVKTVEAHRASIMVKMKADNLVDLVRLADSSVVAEADDTKISRQIEGKP